MPFIIPALRRHLRRCDSGQDHLVWDVPNPFAAPDPDLAHLRRLVDHEIARNRRYESIAPHEPVDGQVTDHGDDADDEDEDDEHTSEHAEDETKPKQITLPRLLPLPLRFLPSPPSSPSPPPSSPTDDETSSINSEAEDRDRAARKAKRDAQRSRAKALAILGPEATQAVNAL